jgi:hypothetical protein
MKIKLPELKAYIINLEDHEQKKETSIAALSSVGITDISVFKAFEKNPGRVGLSMSFREIFKQIDGHEDPILICEDDIAFNPVFNLNEIEIPDDADALYIGIDRNGRIPFINPYLNRFGPPYIEPRDKQKEGRRLVVKKINEDVYRAYNMLAAHAIVMINNSYTKFLENALEVPILNGGHQDLVRATTMPYFKIYALNIPVFYQKGPNEISTNVVISDLSDEFVSYKIEDL